MLWAGTRGCWESGCCGWVDRVGVMGVYARRGELVLLVCGYRGCCGRGHETGRVVLWACTRDRESGCCGRVHETGRVGVVGVYTRLDIGCCGCEHEAGKLGVVSVYTGWESGCCGRVH